MDPLREANPMSGLGIGSLIWIVLSTIIAMYVGGWSAGRLSGVALKSDGLLHGAVTWAVSLLFAVVMVTSASGAVISGASSLLGGMVSTGAQATAASPQLSQAVRDALQQRGIDINSIEQQVRNPQNQQQQR